MRVNLQAVLLLALGTCCCCAHEWGADGGRDVDRPPFVLYEVEFYFDGEPLKLLRQARCNSDIVCPKYAQGQAPAPKPWPMLPVSPFPPGRNDHSVSLSPSPDGKAGTLTVRVRLTDSVDTLRKWAPRRDPRATEEEVAAAAEHLLKEPPVNLTWLPEIPVDVALLTPALNSTTQAQCRDYFYRRRELAERRRANPDFRLEQLRADLREYFTHPAPEGCVAGRLRLNEWVEFEVALDERTPLTLSLLTPDADLTIEIN